MMLQSLKTISTFCVLALLSRADGSGVACVDVVGGVQTQSLYAGQTINIGTVTTEVVADNLRVEYTTYNGWELTETHLWVGANIADMPQTRRGSPKIGNFPYNSGDITGATTYTVDVPLSALSFSCPSPHDKSFHVAAHAAVRLVDANGVVVQGETAWANGDLFVEKGMWGTFFTTTLTCNCAQPPEEGHSCETAFARGGDAFTTCFLDIDEDGDTKGDFNRWGWTQGPLAEGFSTTNNWPVWAAAGQCDITKGTHVGHLGVTYNAGTAVVTLTMLADFTFNEIHVYVGSDPLARNNGDYTVAPGQYPVVKELAAPTASDVVTIHNLSGEIYVVVHAVVCAPDTKWAP